MKSNLLVRFRIDFEQRCSLGSGKIWLLEMIDRTGSLSKAAREMGMSYRRAWLLMDRLNKSFDKLVVSVSVGGSGGGGAALTPLGRKLINSYRALEHELTALAQQRLHDIEPYVRKTELAKTKKKTTYRSTTAKHAKVSKRSAVQ
jgi:molybdate transport system regulatory protein